MQKLWKEPSISEKDTQILDYPYPGLVTPAAEKPNGNANPRVPAWKSDFYNRMYVNPEDAGNALCSPCLAEERQLKKMPPTVMIYCDNDTFRDENITFVSRLMQLGITVYTRCYLHSNHGFTTQRRDEYQVAERMIFAALEYML